MLIYNTATNRKEEFIPVIPGRVSMYACGPTVYNYFHIGNARAFLFFDTVRRYFEYRGFEVNYTQNITDIDDKIIAQSIEERIPFTTVATKYIKAFLEDCAMLGIKTPTNQPKASEVMDEVIDLIKSLENKGHAYEVDGDVYFDTASLAAYGRLSGRKTEDQLAGARVAENTAKRSPADFTLWKHSKPGEPVWKSPWGDGRPGWHTECVVMGRKFLGDTFDIHGGGVDLIFPHHENELAQAMALTGKPLANYWMHNGFLNIEGEKMSKSLNNFFTARDVLSQHSADAIRFFFLSKHYRSPIDFNREILGESERAIKNFLEALKSIDFLSIPTTLDPSKLHGDAEQEFVRAMDDDFNTAKALAVLFDLAHQARNKSAELSHRQSAAAMMLRLGAVLGFFQTLPDEKPEELPNLSKQLIELIITLRQEARERKDWAASDRLRDELSKLGIELKDSREGCTWTIKE
jgi:cysteinyl-tRNA synthetase